jgi:hypothetical protein
MPFRRGFEINAKYKFKDDDGIYTFIGLSSESNYAHAYCVFIDVERQKRRRINVHEAKKLLMYESNA